MLVINYYFCIKKWLNLVFHGKYKIQHALKKTALDRAVFGIITPKTPPTQI